MAQNIPMASAIVAGLLSQEDKIKLDALPGSITGTAADPLSASIVRANQLSASYFSMSSGQINNLSATRITVQDLIVQNSNITGTAGGAVSASIVQAFNLSASYFEFISGNIRTLTGTGIQTTWFSASSGTIHVLTAAYISGTEFRARTGSFSIVNSHIMTATNFSASSGSIHVLTGVYISGTTLTVQDLVVVNSNITASSALLSASIIRAHNLSASYFEFISGNVRTLTGTGLGTMWLSASSGTIHVLTAAYVNTSLLTGTGISGSSGTFHVLTGAYILSTWLTGTTGSFSIFSASSGSFSQILTASTGTIFLLSGGHAFIITASIPNLSASAAIKAFNLSASYFEFISGNVRTLTGTGIKTTWLSASSGTIDVLTGAYISSTKLVVYEVYGTDLGSENNLNLTATHRINLNSNQIDLSGGASISAIAREVTLFGNTDVYIEASGQLYLTSAAVISNNLTVETILSASSGTIHVVTASYLTGTEFRARTGSFSIINSHIMTATNFTASSGSIFLLSSSLAGIITASINTLSSSLAIRAYNLSSSYFEFISGNVRTLTGTGIATTWLTATSGTIDILTASYLTGTEFKARTGSFSIENSHIMTATNFTASSGSIFLLSGGYSNFITATIDRLSSSITIKAQELSASYLFANSGSVTLFSGTGISGSSGTYHVLTASYMSATRLTVQDLVVINTNMSGGAAADPFSASIIRAHNLSASYFEFISGNVRTLTGTGLGTTWLSASSGTFHVLTGAYISGTRLTVQDLVVINSNITASVGFDITSSINTTKIVQIQVTDPNGSAISTGDGKAYFIVPSELGNFNLKNAQAALVTGSTSGVPTVQIRNVTAGVDMLSTKITIDVADNPATSYTAATPSVIDLANDDIQTGEILAVDIDVAGTGAKGLVVILTFESININTISALSASLLQTHNLSASYFQLISGNVRTLTGTGLGTTQLSASTGTIFLTTGTYSWFISSSINTISSSVSVQSHILSSSFAGIVTASINDISSSVSIKSFNLSASYFEFISGNVRTLTGTGIASTWESASSGTYHVMTESYVTSTISQVFNISASYGHIATASHRSLMITGVASVSPTICFVANTNFSQAASTLQAIPFMSHSIAAGEIWKVECQLITAMTGTGGVRFSVAAPTGATIRGFMYGTGSSAATAKPVALSATNTEMGQVFTNVTLNVMPVMLYFTIINGNTAGTVNILSKRATATDTLFISTGSCYEATKARVGENNTL